MMPDFGAGGNVPPSLKARISPPSPRSGSSSLGGDTPPTLVMVPTSKPATRAPRTELSLA
eukprot:2477489-Pyramimonas_sp.AAC.1